MDDIEKGKIGKKDEKKDCQTFYQKNKKELQLVLITVLLSALLSALVSFGLFNYQFSTSTLSERKTIANGYLSDLYLVQIRLDSFRDDYIAPLKNGSIKNSGWGTPIYPEWGLYYSNRQDISKFDPELSKDMVTFYNLILESEYYRNEVNNWETLHPIRSNQSFANYSRIESNDTKSMLNIMDKNTDYCLNNLLPRIRQNLTKIANS
jgi:hypothetical protein